MKEEHRVLTPLETQLKQENEQLHLRLNELLNLLQSAQEQNTEKTLLLEQKEKEYQALAERTDLLLEQVQVLVNRLYGLSSEKRKQPMDGQIIMDEVARLFDEAEVFEEEATPEPDLSKPSKPKKTKQGHRLIELFANLPKQEVIYRIPDGERICSECGSELTVVGVRHNRYEIEYIPSRVNLLDIMQETCSCPSCSKEKIETVFVEPVIPEPVLQHSYASPSSIAYTMYQKYVQAIPLYRQVNDWKRMGVELSRGTLSSWVIKASEAWLYPILDWFKATLDREPVLHADETPVQVLKEPDRKNTCKSYMWVLASGPHSEKPIRYFEYGPGRGQEVADRLLSGFGGYLVTDDYVGYNGLSKVRRCSCWAHIRRRFVEVPCSKGNKGASATAGEALRLIGKLFSLERTLSVMTPDERKKVRLREARPILDEFWAFVDENASEALPKTMLGKAFAYAKSNRDRSKKFLEDGRIEITNAIAENAIRPFAVGRKNWLFSGSPKGARASACVYSLVETAKANGLDPFKYLKTLFEQIPGSDYRANPETMERLMPWSNHMQAVCLPDTRQNPSTSKRPGNAPDGGVQD